MEDRTEDQLWLLGVPDIKLLLLEVKLPRFGSKAELIVRLLKFQKARREEKERKEEVERERASGFAAGRMTAGGSGGEASSLRFGGLAGEGEGESSRSFPQPSILAPAPPPTTYPLQLPSNSNRLPPNFIAAPAPSRIASPQGVEFHLNSYPSPHPPPFSSLSQPSFSHSLTYPAVRFSAYDEQPFFENSLRSLPPLHPSQPQPFSAWQLYPSPQPLLVPPTKRKSPHPPTLPDFPAPPLQRLKLTTFDLARLVLVDVDASQPLYLPHTSSPSSSSQTGIHPPRPRSSQTESLPVALRQPWRRVLSRTIVCAGVEVGSIYASFVDRNLIRKGKFHEVCWDADADMGEFAMEAFDADGRVREELVSGPESGTGAFREEISRGTFIYIHSFSIHLPAARSQRLGFTSFRLLLALLDKLKFQGAIPYFPSFMFAHARLLDALDPPLLQSPEEVKYGTERAVGFFRRVGFRRIGQTPYFAYAITDTNHPSRGIPAETDSPPLPSLPTNAFHLYPLQTLLLSRPLSLPQLHQTLLTCPLPLLSLLDHRLQTPLHIAAQLGMFVACRILVERSPGEVRSVCVRGLTPAEVSRRQGERKRARREVGLDEQEWERRKMERREVETFLEDMEGRR